LAILTTIRLIGWREVIMDSIELQGTHSGKYSQCTVGMLKLIKDNDTKVRGPGTCKISSSLWWWDPHHWLHPTKSPMKPVDENELFGVQSGKLLKAWGFRERIIITN